MKNTTIEKIKSELGEWPTGTFADHIQVFKHQETDDWKNLEKYAIYNRPNGLQISALNEKVAHSLLYNEIEKVELIFDSYPRKKHYSVFLSCIIFGFLFFMLGGLFKGENLAIIWLPNGIVFGFLFSMKFYKTIRFHALKNIYER